MNIFQNMSETNFYVIAKGSIRACLIMINHIYFLTYLCWVIILYPLNFVGLDHVFRKIEGQIMFGLIRMVAMWNQWAGYEVWEAGDDISSCLEERTLVVVNHQTAEDVIMLFSAFVGRKQIIPNIMWIMDRFIKFSIAGVVSSIRKDFFILQGKETRNETLETLARHIKNFYLPLKRKWLVLFPEGGFLSKRKMKSQKYAALNNLPILKLVTIPRVGAFNTILNELGVKKNIFNNDRYSSQGDITSDKLRYILDVTIGYPNGKPLGFTSIVFANKPPCKIVIFYRLYSVDEVLLDEKGPSNWLISRWVEKDELLKEFYETGEYPLESNQSAPRCVKQNYLRFCALHAIFLLLTIAPYLAFLHLYQ